MKPTYKTLSELAHYNLAQANHIEQLYEVALSFIPRMSKTEFISEIYVGKGISERFRKYYEGQRHMVSNSELEQMLVSEVNRMVRK